MYVDTIAAIATSVGHSGIGIVRLSGPVSLEIVKQVFRSVKGLSIECFEARRMMYGIIVDSTSEQAIDEVLLVYMPAPHSYTCEDVVEIQAHGSAIVLRRILTVVLQHGARLALPGEFTQRAYLNGRIDLIQAEAVLNIINAKTEASLKVATQHLSGDLSKRIAVMRNEILDFLVALEAAIDFPEEIKIDFDDLNFVLTLDNLIQRVDKLLSSADYGSILRQGLQTVIVGRPNVGKSSFLNAILGVERALVTDIPGTTRDSIEEYLNVRGLPICIIDTAGLRHTEDFVEERGIQRTRDVLQGAGLILFIVDITQAPCEEDKVVFDSLPNIPVIIVVNKIDLQADLSGHDWRGFFGNHPVVYVSAKDKIGFDLFEELVEEVVLSGKVHLSEDVAIDNVLHIDCLRSARAHLLAVQAAFPSSLPLDCIAHDMRCAFVSLGQITGDTASDEVIQEIFSQFCVGK